MVGAMRELGVSRVPFSPLGRGFLTGTLDTSSFDAKGVRAYHPRFMGEADEAIAAIAAAVGVPSRLVWSILGRRIPGIDRTRRT